MQTDMWTHEAETAKDVTRDFDLTGYGVEAIDGPVGKVDEATYELRSSYVVVDTGPWILGKKVVLPAELIQQVDEADQKIYVDRTKDEIKQAPEFDDSLVEDVL